MRHELTLDMKAQKDGITYETGVAFKAAQNMAKEKNLHSN